MKYTLDIADIKNMRLYTKSEFFENTVLQDHIFDDMRCFNTWQSNSYLSPEQLDTMERTLTFLITMAIVSEVFSSFKNKKRERDNEISKII
jgi:hypothetical protein